LILSLSFSAYASNPSPSTPTTTNGNGPCGRLANRGSTVIQKNVPKPFTRERFEWAKKEVLSLFVGRNSSIEHLFDQIEGWYLYPRTRLTPLIINIWGMTGTGKTSIIKEIIKHLGLDREFFYFDMEQYAGASSVDGTSFKSSLTNELFEDTVFGGLKIHGMVPPKNPVILFDEIHKITTRNSQGESIERPMAQGAWELLGNQGKVMVSNPAYSSLRLALQDSNGLSSHIIAREGVKPDDPEFPDLIRQAQQLFEQTPRHVEVDLSHSLIFVAGNLDHVFQGSHLVDPEVVGANQLHTMTSGLRESDIHAGLATIYRPEHHGRLGSRHFVFPNFSEQAFENYIDSRLAEIASIASKDFGIRLVFSPEFRNRIYNEGVIPTKGLRPLSQTIDTFALDPLARMAAIVEGEIEKERKKAKTRTRASTSTRKRTSQKKKKTGTTQNTVVEVDIDQDQKRSIWTITQGKAKGREETFKIPFNYVNSLTMPPEPQNTFIAVRLAGKVTLGIQTLRQLPTLVRTTSVMSDKNGFVTFNINDPRWNRDLMLRREVIDRIAYILAEYSAENVILGEPSLASMNEIKHATSTAKKMAGMTGLGTTDPGQRSLVHVDVVDRPNLLFDVEAILQEAQHRAEKVLSKERQFFAALIARLQQKVMLSEEEVLELVKEHWSDQTLVEQLTGNQDEFHSPLMDRVRGFVDDPGGFQFSTSKINKKMPAGF